MPGFGLTSVPPVAPVTPPRFFIMTQIINAIELGDPIPSIIHPSGDYPNMLILGGGRCVWEDYFAAREIMPTSYVMGVNDIAGQFKIEKMHHAVSLHGRVLPAIRGLRLEKGCCETICTHSDYPGAGITFVWKMQNSGGTSGLFALKIALALGCKKIILCGIPMDGSGHYFDPPDVRKNFAEVFGSVSNFAPWRDVAKSQIAVDRVRSMSGKTASLFKEPTKDWVES